MSDFAISLVQRYRSRGILVDTNILLLFFVGSFDRSLISRFKRTKSYSAEDYDVLSLFLSKFDCIATTPNVLSEVNSLSNQLGEPARNGYFRNFADGIRILSEAYVASADVAILDCFCRLGLTDSGIVKLVKGNYVVLTDDFRLYGYLENAGIDVLNFAHLRPIL